MCRLHRRTALQDGGTSGPPKPPSRARAEFARLLKDARALRKDAQTPVSNKAMEIAASHMNDDTSVLSGTPYRLLEKIGRLIGGIPPA